MGSGYRKRGLWVEVMGGLCTSNDEVTRVNAFTASRTGRKYRKKRGNPLEFQHGTSMIIRITKDIFLTMSDASSRLCRGLPKSDI